MNYFLSRIDWREKSWRELRSWELATAASSGRNRVFDTAENLVSNFDPPLCYSSALLGRKSVSAGSMSLQDNAR